VGEAFGFVLVCVPVCLAATAPAQAVPSAKCF